MCTQGILVAFSVVGVCWTVVTALRVPLGDEFIQETAHLSISNHVENSLQRQKRDLSVFPEYTNISIKTNSRGEVLLNLQRSRTIDVNIPVYAMKDSKVQLKQLNTLQNVAVYTDIRNGASILLERVELDKNSNNFSLFGTFHTKGKYFVIQPHEMGGHVVSRVPEQKTVFEMSPIIKGRKEHQTPRANMTRTSGRYKRQAIQHMIEVFIVTDFELYNFWYAMTSGSNRVEKTLQSIRQYMSYVLNEMDMRYRNMGRSDYTVGILSAGVFIAESASAATWSESSKFFSDPKYRLTSDSTLDTFRDWVNQQNFPSNDHVMGFTGYDLVNIGSEAGSGIAYTEALCTSSSVSLVEDRLTFISMTTATHELGHSLGALHDGTNNGCSSNDNYVMSVVNQVTNDPIKGPHLWEFSSCSKDAFKSYIDSLNLVGNNCMLTASSGSMPATVDTPMAELYSPDETCVYAIGAGSYVCRSIQDYSTICISMYCNEPGTTQCYTVLPAEGIPCGNGKWCQNGQCVASNDAPSDVTDNCPIGDQPYVIDGYGQTCTEIVASDPGSCYNTYIQTVCCQSCQNANTGVQGCEYGDKNANQCSQLPRVGCYNNEDFCCAKCAAIKNTQIPGCEFGDTLSGCDAQYCAGYSQNSREGCCETCFDGSTVSTSTSTTKPTTATTKSTSTTSSTSTSTASSTSRTSTPPPVSSTSSTVSFNGSLTTTSTPEESQGSDLVIIAAGVAGGVIVLVIIIILVCVFRKRRSKSADKSGSNGTYDNIGFVEGAPNRPPPRRIESDVRGRPPIKPMKPSAPIKPMSINKSGIQLKEISTVT